MVRCHWKHVCKTLKSQFSRSPVTWKASVCCLCSLGTVILQFVPLHWRFIGCKGESFSWKIGCTSLSQLGVCFVLKAGERFPIGEGRGLVKEGGASNPLVENPPCMLIKVQIIRLSLTIRKHRRNGRLDWTACDAKRKLWSRYKRRLSSDCYSEKSLVLRGASWNISSSYACQKMYRYEWPKVSEHPAQIAWTNFYAIC